MPRLGAGRRYAEAAFELATRDGTVDVWQRELAVAAGLARDANRREAVEQLLGSRVSRQVLNLSLILTERGRFSVLPSVADEYDALVRRSRGIVAATVTTPAALSKAELAAVRTRVEQLAGTTVELGTETDPSLIGGLTVKIGDRLIDASVRGRLERLRGRLVQGTS
jgi:F-type H+-transporting ATPase subunit delta